MIVHRQQSESILIHREAWNFKQLAFTIVLFIHWCLNKNLIQEAQDARHVARRWSLLCKSADSESEVICPYFLRYKEHVITSTHTFPERERRPRNSVSRRFALRSANLEVSYERIT